MNGRSDVSSADERVSSVLLADPAAAPFQFSAGPYESPTLAVLSLRGREAISKLFSFEVTVAASPAVDDTTIEADLLGSPACLAMQAGSSSPRFVRGVVAAVAAQSAVHGRRAVYRLRVVPALWLLKKRTTSRIFQDQSVPEIVAAVLDEAGVANTLRLLGKYRPRSYCVQYRESDFAFVERLLAEEGIFYTFDHGGSDADTEIVTLSDSARLYPVIADDPTLIYRPHEGTAGMAQGEHHVQRFELERSLRPTSVFRKGYDFRRPGLELIAEGKLEDMSGGEPERGEVYEHHEEDEQPNVRPEAVAAELEQHRARVEVGVGASGCRRLVPGARFTLRDHDLGRLDREYVVTTIKHEGRAPGAAASGEAVYSNTFECVPATIAARPPRPTRSIQQVTETARVVGPAGQEIYTDEYGRVKVQFHWDRAGQNDEHSSCWIRAVQAWAGSGWGFEFFPRVGMEVVVTFLGGDVDRPLIVGSLYNATNAPPFPLPASKTKSGIVTRSTPLGVSGNELSFEDAKGKEQVILHAQRDLRESVGNDRDESVGRDRLDTVARHANEKIRGNMTLDVGGQLGESVHGNRWLRCDGDISQSARGRYTQRAEGNFSTTVDKDYTLHVAGSGDAVIGTQGKGSHYSSMVYGDQILGATETVTIRADKKLVLQCGATTLELSPDGVRIRGPHVDLTGTESASISGKGPALRLDDEAQLCAKTLRLFSSDASLVLDKDAKLKGTQVKLNCDDEKPTDPKGNEVQVEKVPFKLKLSDAEYGVYANKKYHLSVDGATYEGTTDSGGVLEKQVPKDAKSLTIVLWNGEYPTGKEKRWTIRMAPMGAADTVRGAQERLVNLGYFSGEPKDEMDDVTRSAIRDFQAHVGVPVTGQLDAATAEKLNTLHGK